MADQYQQLTGRSRIVTDEALQSLIDSSKELTTGWKQRLTSLLPSIDPEQVLAKMRTDGAAWFEPDFGLTPDSDQESSETDSFGEQSPDDTADDNDAEQDVAESVLRSRERSDAPDGDEAANDETMDEEDSDD